MKTFTIEISLYPQAFIISANTKDEAIEQAKQRFFDKNDGKSIYETIVTEEESL